MRPRTRLVELICSCEFTHEGDELPLSVAIGVAMIDGSEDPRHRHGSRRRGNVPAQGGGLNLWQGE